MVDQIKNYGIAGIGANVQLGVNGAVIKSSNSNVSFQTADGNLSVVSVANATVSSHAVTKAQLDAATSQKVQYAKYNVDYSSGTVSLGSIQANGYIHSVVVEAVQEWTGANSNTNIIVGDSTNSSRLFSDFDPTVQSVDETDYRYNSTTELTAVVTPGNASSGNATITVWYTGIISDPGAGGLSPTLMLNLDAAGYTSGPWIDTVASRSFTLYGGVGYSAAGGGSLVFDPASSQYAECSSSLSNLNTWTVVAWHYYDGTNTGPLPCILTEVYPSTTNEINYTLGVTDFLAGDNTLLTSAFFDGGWRYTPYPGYSLTAGNWYQIVGTYDGSQIKLYVNNTLVDFVNYTGTPISGGGGIRLMRRWDDANYWGGKLGIVQVYDGAMDATQVAANWNANKTRFSL